MITVDYMSNFWEVDRLESTTSQTVIRKLKAHFARHGIPNSIMSDNGPQFKSSEFIFFSKKVEFPSHCIKPRIPATQQKG